MSAKKKAASKRSPKNAASSTSTAKKSQTSRSSAKKAVTKKSPANEAAIKKAETNKTAARQAKKSTANKTVTRKSPAKKAATKKAPAKNVTDKKTTEKKAPVKKATAKKETSDSATSSSARTIPAKHKFLHDEKWLAKQREALLRERANYTTSADRLAAEAAALMADREPGDVQFDEESGEGDTIAVERDRDLALSAAARQSVADIDAALLRLDNNTYGLCVAGDDVIPRERLEAIPEASVCVTHKTLMF